MRNITATAILLTGMAAAPASAACLYQGVYYSHGSNLCFDGWLQECTVADYWSAIGICNASDQPESIVQNQGLATKTLVAMILGEDHSPAYSRIVEEKF